MTPHLRRLGPTGALVDDVTRLGGPDEAATGIAGARVPGGTFVVRQDASGAAAFTLLDDGSVRGPGPAFSLSWPLDAVACNDEVCLVAGARSPRLVSFDGTALGETIDLGTGDRLAAIRAEDGFLLLVDTPCATSMCLGAVRITSAGEVLDSPPIALLEGIAAPYALAEGPAGVLAVAVAEDGTALLARRVPQGGAAGAPVSLSPVSGAVTAVQVAHDGSRFVVTWQISAGADRQELWLAYAADDGTPLAPAGTLIGTRDGGRSDAALACRDGTCVLVYEVYDEIARALRLHRLLVTADALDPAIGADAGTGASGGGACACRTGGASSTPAALVLLLVCLRRRHRGRGAGPIAGSPAASPCRRSRRTARPRPPRSTRRATGSSSRRGGARSAAHG